MTPEVNRRILLQSTLALATIPTEGIAEMVSHPIVELRQYTLHGGRRDELIDLFESAFIEPQNAVGAHVLATFRDLDDLDRFVWMRGFASMEARKAALGSFYDGESWKNHRDAANATMLDSDNVLLLCPASRAGAVAADIRKTPPSDVIRLTISYLGDADIATYTKFFETRMRPELETLGAVILETYVTELAPNNFRLPVREHENVFIWMARFGDQQAEQDFTKHFSSLSGWRDRAPASLLPAFMRKPEVLRLAPTAQSPLL